MTDRALTLVAVTLVALTFLVLAAGELHGIMSH